MPNTRRAGRGRGVDLRPLAGEHPQAHAAGGQVLHGVDQMGEVAAEAVELPDDEHVALPQGAQAAVESRPVVAYAGGEVVVEVGRRSSRHGRSRSACVANGRLGHGATALASRGLRAMRSRLAEARSRTSGSGGNPRVTRQITMRSISSTVTVSAVRS